MTHSHVRSLLLAVVLACFGSIASAAPPETPAPDNTYILGLRMVSGTEPVQWVFTIGFPHGLVGVSTPEYLRKYIELTIPGPATLQWDPGCKRFGGEPLLSSETELTAFKAFLKERKIELVILPGG